MSIGVINRVLTMLLNYNCYNHSVMSGVPVWRHFFLIDTFSRFLLNIWKYFNDAECVCVCRAIYLLHFLALYGVSDLLRWNVVRYEANTWQCGTSDSRNVTN